MIRPSLLGSGGNLSVRDYKRLLESLRVVVIISSHYRRHSDVRPTTQHLALAPAAGKYAVTRTFLANHNKLGLRAH